METDYSDLPVLITGAAGFIGSHLARALLLRNAKVHIVVRPGTTPWRLGDILDQVTLHRVDIRDYEGLRIAIGLAAPVKVFHLAALVTPERKMELLGPMIQTNIQGTVNLLQSLRESNTDCIVNAGTCEEYGDGQPPFEESQREQPVSPYSATKVAATYIARMMHRVAGLPVVTVRPFLTYGPAQESEMLIPALIRAALQGREFAMTAGEQTREFNYVDDIVRGCLVAACTPGAVGEVLNLGNGVEHRIADVAGLIVELVGKPVRINLGALPYRPGEAMRFYSLSSKAMRLLQWRPSVDLREGLTRTIDWHRRRMSALQSLGGQHGG